MLDVPQRKYSIFTMYYCTGSLMYCDTMQYFLMTILHEENLFFDKRNGFFLYKCVAKNHNICIVDHRHFLYVRCTIMLFFPSGKRYNDGNKQATLQRELKPLLDKVKDIKAVLALPETREKIYREVFGKTLITQNNGQMLPLETI